MRPGNFGSARRTANVGPNVAGLSPAVLEAIERQGELMARVLNDPVAARARRDAMRAWEERSRALADVPGPAARRAIKDTLRYLNSPEFQARRQTITRSMEEARRRLGLDGLAAAGRVAERRAASEGATELAAERIEAGEAPRILEEAASLATSPEVVEAIRSADPEAVARLDQEQRHSGPGSVEEQGRDAQATGPGWPEAADEAWILGLFDRRPTRQEVLDMHDGALMVLIPLEVALVVFTAVNPAAPIVAALLAAVTGLIGLVTLAKLVISALDREGGDEEN